MSHREECVLDTIVRPSIELQLPETISCWAFDGQFKCGQRPRLLSCKFCLQFGSASLAAYLPIMWSKVAVTPLFCVTKAPSDPFGPCVLFQFAILPSAFVLASKMMTAIEQQDSLTVMFGAGLPVVVSSTWHVIGCLS